MDVKRVLQALAIGAALLTVIVETVKLAREVHPGPSAAEPRRDVPASHPAASDCPGGSNPDTQRCPWSGDTQPARTSGLCPG